MRPEEIIGQILGHYRLIRPLGYGGSATVFLAEDINLQREVAVKVFMPREGNTQDFLRRFAREARVLAQLDHPHILPVYEYGEKDGSAYLVMPHMAGGSLRDWLRGRGAIPGWEAVRLMSQILSALQYALECNLIHRDIKPGNMLFKADGTLMLSDFGLVKVLATESADTPLLSQDASMTTHALTGTPDYMAPEQINGKVVPASDIYAMGVVLYEMLTGTYLFEAENYMGILVKHLYEQPRPLHEVNSQISSALEAIVLRCLEKDPARRYQRPADLRQALLQVVAGDQATFVGTNIPTVRPDSSMPMSPPTSTPPVQHKTDDYGPTGPVHLQRSQSTPGMPSSPTQSYAHASTPYTPAGGQPTPVFHPTIPAQSGPTQHSRSNRPLIIALILIILALAASLSGVLYTQGVFKGHNTQATPTPGGTQQNKPPTTGITPVNKGASTPGNSNNTTSAQIPSTQTACPNANQARAAIIAPLALGNRQNIVYIVNEGSAANPLAGTIKRREVNPGITGGVEISKIAQAYISEAQISQDGMWVLFVATIDGQSQLRMVRVDGQGLQTLYCAPTNDAINHAQWSFDQKTVIFNVASAAGQPTTYLLDVVSGNVQPELVSQSNLGYNAQTWLDNTHAYVVSFVPNPDGGPQDIYLLDIKKGANQHDGDLQKIVAGSRTCGNLGSFDSSYDSKLLLLSTCTLAAPAGGGLGAPAGPSTITSQPATGGSAQTIEKLSQAVTMLRAISPTTLLLLIENYSGDTSKNGLWKINTDGTGLTQLSSDKNNMQSLCQFTQYAWSNVSRDGQYYALQEVDAKTNTYNMYYGSMSGGTPTQFASIKNTQLLLAGWISL